MGENKKPGRLSSKEFDFFDPPFMNQQKKSPANDIVKPTPLGGAQQPPKQSIDIFHPNYGQKSEVTNGNHRNDQPSDNWRSAAPDTEPMENQWSKFQMRNEVNEHKNINGSHPAFSMRNGGSSTKKNPVFTPMTSRSTTSPKLGDEVGRNGTQQKKYVVNKNRSPIEPPHRHIDKPSLHPQRRHSPTISSANVDAFQPAFQQVLDKVPMMSIRKNGSNEKPKGKKSALNRVAVDNIMNEIMDSDTCDSGNIIRLSKNIEDAKIPTKHLPRVIYAVVTSCLCHLETDVASYCMLIKRISENGLIQEHDISEGIRFVIEDDQIKEEFTKQRLASIVAQLLVYNLILLSEFAESLNDSCKFPLFLMTLNHYNKVKSDEDSKYLFENSKIELSTMLPEQSKSKSVMHEILEQYELSFLMPLVHIEYQLSNQIAVDPNPQLLYRWVKENIDTKWHAESEFINVVVSCCLDYITRTTSLHESVSRAENPPQNVKDEERHLLASIKLLLQKFLFNKSDLQLHALYATQVFCHERDFPKGLLLRLFNMMYEEDVIDSDIFLLWKEDMKHGMYPGKGKALFQVNAWLSWLQTPDSDEEE